MYLQLMTLVVPSGLYSFVHCLCNKTGIFVFDNSHYYIVISLIKLEDTNDIQESELASAVQGKRNANLPLYITASVNYEDFHPTFTIGDGSISTDPISQRIFYNVPLQKEQIYYYFIRVYSEAHTPEVSHT